MSATPERIWAAPYFSNPCSGYWDMDELDFGANPYILATPEAIADSPEVQALIAEAEARGLERAKSTGLPSAQRILDRNVLQYMEECRPGDCPRSGFAYHLNCFVAEPWVTKDMAWAICRSLTDRGYAFYMRGLWSEDGEPLGAGYGITDAGAYYLASLLADQQAAIRSGE